MIESFKEHKFLSNFYRLDSPINYLDADFYTVEHFYMANKCSRLDQFYLIANCKTPAEAKKLGRKVELRPDWEDIKVKVMTYALQEKFSPRNKRLMNMLEETGEEYIKEGNYWNDKYRGVCLKTGEGLNMLGKLLMERRKLNRELYYNHA